VTAAAALALAVGWRLRAEAYWTAAEGAGYALGVAGLAMMLLLLLYPLRKRLAPLRSWGPPRSWLQVHMALGILGPTCILLHANFRPGSTNSRMALFSMLVVAGSGFLGRFVYTRIHSGYFGQRVSLGQLCASLAPLRSALREAEPELEAELELD